MLYHLFRPLAEFSIYFNVFRYVTFRSAAAFVTALFFAGVLGPYFIRMLQKKQAVEEVDPDGPHGHVSDKAKVPTMGGLIILTGLLIAIGLWCDLTNTYIMLMVLTIFWLGGIGFLDDYLKNFRKERRGLVEKYKLLGQISLALFIGIALYLGPDSPGIARISIPFLKHTFISLGVFFIPYVIFMITATSNAVNLTDGLDGLAAGTIAISTLALGIMAYLKGNIKYATYLNLEFIQPAGELTILTAAIIGTLLGFLWFNTKPAQIFMGDTGSLALGGLLANLAILLREPIFFAIVGGIFVVEAGSSLVQRYYFKYWRVKTGTGKRLFLMAPLHHHFERKGFREEKIVVRFWIVAILLATVGLATLKLR